MNKSLRWAAGIAAASLILTACGDAPDEGETEGEATATATATEMATEGEATATAAAESDLAACMVTDTGGVDDRSFNQTSYDGLTQAEEQYGVEAKLLESSSETDFQPNINTFLEDDCSLIVTVGFLLGDATLQAAQDNPDQNFAIVDFDFAEFDADGNFVGDISLDNARELTFATDQAAFLAGYLAAGMTQTGTVGTYGGLNIPTVTIFMDGYLAGVRHYNAENGTDVNVLGWDGSDGQFTGNFESQDDGRNLTDQMLAEGADIIMPVAGPVGLGSAAALQESSADDMLIWVDTDGYISAPDYGDLMLTSVQKKMDVAVADTIGAVAEDAFEGGLYVGTLENDGVGIAPFHDFEDAVPDELKAELETLREGIIAGDISVASADY
jgi:basic membrane protein A